MEDKKVLKEARTIFNSLKTDPNSVLFSEDKIDNRLLKKLKKSKYLKDSQLLKLIILADNKIVYSMIRHQPELIIWRKGKLIRPPCIVLMDLFNCSMLM